LLRGADKVGVFRNGYYWVLDSNGNQQFANPPDADFAFGQNGDQPLTGDWNGDGKAEVGIYRPSNGTFYLDYDGNSVFSLPADRQYNLGVGMVGGDLAVVGDWNGDGKAKIGLFRQGFFWILDLDGSGVYSSGTDTAFAFGGDPGDVPVVGKWGGTSKSEVGIFRQGFFWILDWNGNRTIDNVNQGGGDQAFPSGGLPGDVPVVGDWNGNGISKPGVFRAGYFWVLDVNGDHQFTAAPPDLAFAFGGLAGDKPMAGDWGYATGAGTVTVTLNALPAGTLLKADNVGCPAPCVKQWVPGSSHTIEAPDHVTHMFTAWSDGGFQKHAVTAPSVGQTLTATYSLLPPSMAPTGFEINLGAVPLDNYLTTNLTTGGMHQILSCDPTWTIRNCIKQMFDNDALSPTYSPVNYRRQGVTGVRFFYALRGGPTNSTPFDAAGNIQSAWVANLSLFFQDLQSYGITKITPTPVLTGEWSQTGGGELWTGAVSCGHTLDLVILPWLPFGLIPGTGGAPDRSGGNATYDCGFSPTVNLTPPHVYWGWQPLFSLIDAVLGAAKSKGLLVEDYDIENELNFVDFTVAARLIYDSTHPYLSASGTDVLGIIREKMAGTPQAPRFDPNRVTASTLLRHTTLAGYDCTSYYGDSGILLDRSSMDAAIAGGSSNAIGQPVNVGEINGLYCGGANADMISLPVSHSRPTVINSHAYPCILVAPNGPCSSSASAPDMELNAKTMYDAVWNYMVTHQRTGDQAVFGEAEWNQPCQGHTHQMAAANASGYVLSSLKANHAAGTTMRVWNNMMYGSGGGGMCYVAPSLLMDAYNPF
jgi:hypothetical protein